MQIVKAIVKVCLGWSKNWADRLPKEWQKQIELKRWIARNVPEMKGNHSMLDW